MCLKYHPLQVCCQSRGVGLLKLGLKICPIPSVQNLIFFAPSIIFNHIHVYSTELISFFQSEVPKEHLMNALSLEFVNRVNEVGVDVNQAIQCPHTAPLIQFVCGLGPRKGSHLLKVRLH